MGISAKVVGWTPCEHYAACIGWCPTCLRELGLPSTVVQGKVLHCVTFGRGEPGTTGTLLAVDLVAPVYVRSGTRVVVLVLDDE